jgi:hypothetical protein
MKLRIHETRDMDLDTIEKMLFQADKQANFHPESSWILNSTDGEITNHNQDENSLSKKYKDLSVKWIGREAVIMWLVSNQVIFEIITFKLLEEEIEAIGDLDQLGGLDQEHILTN